MPASSALRPNVDYVIKWALRSPSEAMEAARAARDADPGFDLSLSEMLNRDVAVETALVVLDLLQGLGNCERVQMRVAPLLQHIDPKVRSKAAGVLASSSRTVHWLAALQTDPDPRVRANAVEAVFNLDSQQHRQFLRDACGDDHHRVAINAWLGLLLLGDAAAAAELIAQSRSSNVEFRRAAAWAMGHSRDPQFLPRLTEMLGEEAGPAKFTILRAIASIRRSAATGATDKLET